MDYFQPKLVERIIVVDISPFSSDAFGGLSEIFDVLLDVKLPEGVSPSEARKTIDKQLAEHYKSDYFRGFLMRNLSFGKKWVLLKLR